MKSTHANNWGQVNGVILWDDRRELKKKIGEYPIKLRITFKTDRLYKDTGFSMTEEEFDNFDKNKTEIRKKRLPILEQYKHLGETIQKLVDKDEFSFDELNRLLGRGKQDDVFSCFEGYIRDLKKNEQLGTAITYGCALNSIKAYTGSTELGFNRITKTWLESYEKDMTKKENSAATQSIYMRCLRHIILKAKKPNPFGLGKYIIKSGGTREMALTKDEMTKLVFHPLPDGSVIKEMRDLFYFSYLTNGANIKDIVSLKWSDIKNGEIEFKRAKTARTNAKEKTIHAPIDAKMQKIIDDWGDGESDYIFGYYNKGMSAEEKQLICKNLIRLMNKKLRIIAKVAGIRKVSTYSARYSYATHVLEGGASIVHISEQMGNSVEVVQGYFARSDAEKRRKMNETLI